MRADHVKSILGLITTCAAVSWLANFLYMQDVMLTDGMVPDYVWSISIVFTALLLQKCTLAMLIRSIDLMHDSVASLPDNDSYAYI